MGTNGFMGTQTFYGEMTKMMSSYTIIWSITVVKLPGNLNMHSATWVIAQYD